MATSLCGQVSEHTRLTNRPCREKLVEGVNNVSLDAVDGPVAIEIFARVAARFGEHDRAIDALERLLSIPYSGAMGVPLTPALLRLDPMFDPLRADPRFQKLAASAEPKPANP